MTNILCFQIVEPFSAILGLPNERIVPVDADHREIAQVSPRRKHRYKPVWSAITELVEGNMKVNASKEGFKY
jgi:hypothetical protein